MSKKIDSIAILLIFAMIAPVFAQRPTPAPSSAPPTQQQQQSGPDEDDVVRISTNLVQVDVVVTDKDGRQVADLRPEEFEIYEDGRQQKITNFSYISLDADTAQPVAATPSSSAAPADKLAPVVPPVRLRPEQVRRTIALVVDDLGLSFESTAYTRQALKKFVDQQMQAGDLVAIIRTGGGMGALQQFTSDKRQLYAAIERVRWNPLGRGGVSAFAPIEADPLAGQTLAADRGESSEEERNADGDLNDFREEIFSVGTLGALNFVVRGLRELPGRKSVLLISDGIRIFNRSRDGGTERNERILEALRRLTDLANRASVVIYTMDARGLQTLSLTAADNTAGLNPDQLEARLTERRDAFFDSQSGLIYLSRQTGGFAIRNNNDLAGGIKRVLDDQKGYYLIGYRPDDATFDPAKGRSRFHKISVKLKRPNLNHRTRTGFYGISDEAARPIRRTREEQLVGALTSPFSASGVHLRLNSLFANDQGAGSFMRSMLHIDARDLTFTEEADGWHKAIFDVLAITFGDNGRVVDQISRTHTVRLRGETYQYILKNGLIYTLTVPVKKPGAYQLRTALRDTSSERVGSASQFIEVPNLGKNRLTLSGILVSSLDPAEVNKTATGAASTTPDAAADVNNKTDDASANPQAGPAVRLFGRGMLMQFGYVIYNAQLDKATQRPQLHTQVRLFRNGQLIFAGKQQTYDASGQVDLKRLVAGGVIQLGTDMVPGEYVLQAIVTDLLAKEKQRTATQWIDFEIIK